MGSASDDRERLEAMLPVETLSTGKFVGAAKLFTVACADLRTDLLGTG